MPCTRTARRRSRERASRSDAVTIGRCSHVNSRAIALTARSGRSGRRQRSANIASRFGSSGRGAVAQGEHAERPQRSSARKRTFAARHRPVRSARDDRGAPRAASRRPSAAAATRYSSPVSWIIWPSARRARQRRLLEAGVLDTRRSARRRPRAEGLSARGRAAAAVRSSLGGRGRHDRPISPGPRPGAAALSTSASCVGSDFSTSSSSSTSADARLLRLDRLVQLGEREVLGLERREVRAHIREHRAAGVGELDRIGRRRGRTAGPRRPRRTRCTPR